MSDTSSQLISVQDAEEIVARVYKTTDKERVYFDSLSTEDKEVVVFNMSQVIDTPAIRYKGKKLSRDQTSEFPRVINGVTVETPYKLKIAGVKQGLINELLMSSDYSELINSGVKSFADGGGAKVEFNTSTSTLPVMFRVNELGFNEKIYKQYVSEYTIVCH